MTFGATCGPARPAGDPGPAPRLDVADSRASAALVPLSEPLWLPSGCRAALRPLLPRDADALQAFVVALTPASRRARFHGAVNQLPPQALQALVTADFRGHVALVVELDDAAGGGCAVGVPCAGGLVAEARFVSEAPGQAEFALAVADAWQGQGLGRVLLGALGRHARARGIRRLRGAVYSDNAPMLALVHRLGGTVRADARDASLAQAWLDLARNGATTRRRVG